MPARTFAMDTPNGGAPPDCRHSVVSTCGFENAGSTGLRPGGIGLRIAGVPDRHEPDRHEPDRGEVNYPYFFDLLDRLGYHGWAGCEYRPAGDTLAGLGWARAYGIATAKP